MTTSHRSWSAADRSRSVRSTLRIALNAVDLTAAAARKAAADAGGGEALLQALDAIVVLRSFSDTSWRFKSPFGGPAHPPRSVAKRLNLGNVRRLIYTHPGGNMPQWCVNRLFEMIAARRDRRGHGLRRRGAGDPEGRRAGAPSPRLERGRRRQAGAMGCGDPRLERHGRSAPHGRRDLRLPAV